MPGMRIGTLAQSKLGFKALPGQRSTDLWPDLYTFHTTRRLEVLRYVLVAKQHNTGEIIDAWRRRDHSG